MQPTHTQAQKTVAGIEFPATRARLVDHARRNGADEDLLDRLNRIPERFYHDPNEVGAAFAEAVGE